MGFFPQYGFKTRVKIETKAIDDSFAVLLFSAGDSVVRGPFTGAAQSHEVSVCVLVRATQM